MDLFKRFQAGRYARRLVTSESLSDAALIETQTQLVAMGPSAITSIFSLLPRGPVHEATLAVLERLLTNETLPKFVEGLRAPEPAVADAAATVLARAQTYDATQILALFADPGISKARLENILDAQSRRVQAATLLRVLPDLGKDARGSVYRLLERRDDPSLVNDAVRLCGHAEWWIRLHMVRLLAKHSVTEAVEAVTRLLRDENPAVRLESVKALERMKATSAAAALCTRLRDPDIKVQTAAIEALIGLADVAAVPHLLDYLKDESEYVRRGAVEVLNQVVTVDAIKDLVSALRDADWWVRVRAADALGTLGGSRVVEAIIGLIEDPDDFIRRYAVEILNTVPDRRAVEPLIRALEDSDWWVRERAIDALAKTADPRAVEPLLRMLGRDSRAIPLCIRALGAIPDVRVVEPMCRLATSENAEIRREALVALTKLTRVEMPEDSRTQMLRTLDEAGIAAERASPLPMEVRGTRNGPETGRNEPVTRRPGSSGSVDGVQYTPPAAPTRQLNFQKLDPGTVLIDRFRVLQRIGGGGFGTVYLVEDTIVREEMVLKILSPQLSLDDNMIRRFVQELKLTRRITHRNVIRIYDLLDLQGAHAISMEHFAGRDLGAVLKQDGPLSVPRALHIADQVLDGLGAAHDTGIVHRDIKPANLLLGDDDLAKIVDFGLAAVGQGTKSRLTQSGILVGTPEYISPEQITGHDVDRRTDLYSLGVVLYEALSGKQPFAGTNAVNVLFQHLECDVPPLKEVAAGVPDAISDVVMRSMSRFANDRPENAAVMLEMLRRAA